MRIELEILEGVPGIHNGKDKFILIDTGSPFSFDESGTIEFFENIHVVPTAINSVIDSNYLTKHFDKKISGLIGMDIMKKHALSFDYKSKSLHVNNAAPRSGKFRDHSFDISHHATNIPIIEVYLPEMNKLVRSIIDTGSKHSYVHSELLVNCQLTGTESDFNPSLGNFTSNRFEGFNYQLGSNIYTHPVCEYSKLSNTLKLINTSMLLGYDFLYQYPWAINSSSNQFFVTC